MKKMPKQHEYTCKIYNGNVRIYVDGYTICAFNQLDYAGHYAYKDATNVYGLDIYLLREKAGQGQMEIYFKTKSAWLAVLKLLDENM
jgi:hypothetical protein